MNVVFVGFILHFLRLDPSYYCIVTTENTKSLEQKKGTLN